MNQNKILNDLARFYEVDGDYMRCRACNRPQIVNRCYSDFPHGAGCSNAGAAPGNPWIILGNAVQAVRASLPPAEGR
jgi:hypothetical protein